MTDRDAAGPAGKAQTGSLPANASPPPPAELTEAELVRVEATTASLVDKLIDGLSPLVERSIQAFEEDRERKAELAKRQLEVSQAAMKRLALLLGGAIALTFALALVALLVHEVDLVKTILTSSLALAAGAGLAAFGTKKRE